MRDAGRFWYGLEARARDRFVGLHAAERLAERGLGLAECIARSSATWGEAIDRALRCVPLLGDRVTAELVRDADTAALVVRTTLGVPMPPQAADICLATIALGMRRLLGGDPVREVCFVHPAPRDGTGEYRRVLGRVRFGADRDEVRFAASLLSRALPRADDRTCEYLASHAATLLSTVNTDADFDARLASAYIAAIERGDCSIRAVSRALAMSPRTLQRRLSAAGTSHRELVESTRHDVAVRYLRESKQTIETIATRLGYSEPSTFARAFRRVSGQSPSEFRDGRPHGLRGLYATERNRT
jgi:AraC-like DNA-binding protein